MSLSRREALAVLLGAPLAAEACKTSPFRSVGGEIRGGAVDLGHRLRGATIEAPSGPEARTQVAIVGAGPSGLSAAWRLERLGIRDFVVFDLEPQPGGTSAYGTDGVVPYPWGAHYVPLPRADNRALVTLLREMDALETESPSERADGEPRGREELTVREPEERVFMEGQWHEGLFPDALSTGEERADLAAFEREVDHWVTWRDARGRRAFTLPVARSSDDADVTALDRQSAAAWLDTKGIRSKRVRWWVEYATRDDYGLSLEQASAWSMLFYFASRRGKPGEDSAPFLAWPEGNGRIVRHLADIAGDRVRTSKLATDVVPREDSVELAVIDARGGGLERWRADYVILAVPKFVAARVLRPWRDQRPAHLDPFTYGSWMVANLHLSRRPRAIGFPLAWDNVIYDSPSLGYVVATHQKLLDRGPTIFTYYLPIVDDDPRAARERLLALDHRQACDAILADLGRAHEDLESVVDRIDLWRWGHAMVRPVPGVVWGGARAKAAEPVGRVHMAHSDLSGVALFEEAQDHGVRAAEVVARALGRELRGLAG